MMSNRVQRSKVFEFTNGLLGKTSDMILASIYFSLEFASAGYGKGWKAAERAHLDLLKFNSATLAQAFRRLRKKGLIQSLREQVTTPRITEEGRKRLKAIIPVYDADRIWDGRVYLVTYDLPRTKNYQRNLLRDYLKKIGCGMLQESVWLTPYNPKELIEEFVGRYKLESELAIVSSLGKDGTVGERQLPELVEEVYNLPQLNSRYREFLDEAKKGKSSKEKLLFAYLSILKDDPQMPFELLPDDWFGDDAHKVFQKLTK